MAEAAGLIVGRVVRTIAARHGGPSGRWAYAWVDAEGDDGSFEDAVAWLQKQDAVTDISSEVLPDPDQGEASSE